MDLEKVQALASIFCTQDEIAAVLGVSVDTLRRRKDFASVYNTGRENAKQSLRRLQWKSAKDGSTGMQIWLGKQYLGQKERIESDVNQDTSIRIRYVNDWRNRVEGPSKIGDAELAQPMLAEAS